MRKFPSSMSTQHPDNADKYITIQEEPNEAIEALTPQHQGGLGIEEIMIDFEGKLTPYHQTSQIAIGLIHNGIIPGKDIFITPRITNASKEPVFRQLMSIMSLVETNILAYKHTSIQAILETIVPMIESGEELITIHERINSVIELGNKNYDIQFPLNSINVIPLIENVPSLIDADKILDDYYKHSVANNYKFNDIRVMLARSDSAMSYGMASSVLALRIALSKLYQWAQRNQVQIAPILGCGSLPFRGHFTDENLENMLNTYAGVKTFTIQSGLKYDHGYDKTKSVVNKLKQNLEHSTPRLLSVTETETLQEYIGIFTKHYMQTFIKFIDSVEFISKYIPKNRDRLASTKTGLQYVREAVDMSKVANLVKDSTLKQQLLDINTDIECAVPRAISFTASMYTIGLPPEFIGIGRGLQEIKEKWGDTGVRQLLDFYPQIKQDLIYASKYVNTKVSKGIIDESARTDYQKDYDLACELLGINNENDEANEDEFYHTLLKSARPIILHLIGKQKDLINDVEEEKKILSQWIIKMAKIRGSLG